MITEPVSPSSVEAWLTRLLTLCCSNKPLVFSFSQEFFLPWLGQSVTVHEMHYQVPTS
jgi:hypothetical protein